MPGSEHHSGAILEAGYQNPAAAAADDDDDYQYYTFIPFRPIYLL